MKGIIVVVSEASVVGGPSVSAGEVTGVVICCGGESVCVSGNDRYGCSCGVLMWVCVSTLGPVMRLID